MGGGKMEVVIRYNLDKEKSQKWFGEFETRVKATITNAEEIVKATDGKAYWYDDRTDKPYFELPLRYDREVRELLTEEIQKRIEEEIEKRKEKEITIDLNKEQEIIQKVIGKMHEIEQKRADEERKRKERGKKEKILQDLINKKEEEGIRIRWYAGNKIEIYIKEDNFYKYIDEKRFNSIDEIIDYLRNFDVYDVYRQYIAKLRQENETLKKQLEKKKQEILKEMYENDEAIEIEDTTTKTLRVYAEEEDDC